MSKTCLQPQHSATRLANDGSVTQKNTPLFLVTLALGNAERDVNVDVKYTRSPERMAVQRVHLPFWTVERWSTFYCG